jgi:predicted ArsR family transcriptional regulator
MSKGRPSGSRLRVIAALKHGWITPAQLSAQIGLSRQAVYTHLLALTDQTERRSTSAQRWEYRWKA